MALFAKLIFTLCVVLTITGQVCHAQQYHRTVSTIAPIPACKYGSPITVNNRPVKCLPYLSSCSAATSNTPTASATPAATGNGSTSANATTTTTTAATTTTTTAASTNGSANASATASTGGLTCCIYNEIDYYCCGGISNSSNCTVYNPNSTYGWIRTWVLSNPYKNVWSEVHQLIGPTPAAPVTTTRAASTNASVANAAAANGSAAAGGRRREPQEVETTSTQEVETTSAQEVETTSAAVQASTSSAAASDRRTEALEVETTSSTVQASTSSAAATSGRRREPQKVKTISNRFVFDPSLYVSKRLRRRRHGN